MKSPFCRARAPRHSLLLATAAALTPQTQLSADTFGSGANQFDMDFVPIGNPGNAPDTTGAPNPAGSVPYGYRIGTYEVSRDLVTKANSAGSLGITVADMTPYGGNGANRPATGVSWYEAAYFDGVAGVYYNYPTGSDSAPTAARCRRAAWFGT